MEIKWKLLFGVWGSGLTYNNRNMLGLCGENGKEYGNYYNGLYRDWNEGVEGYYYYQTIIVAITITTPTTITIITTITMKIVRYSSVSATS